MDDRKYAFFVTIAWCFKDEASAREFGKIQKSKRPRLTRCWPNIGITKPIRRQRFPSPRASFDAMLKQAAPGWFRCRES